VSDCRHDLLTPDQPVEWCRQLLRQPPGPWPPHFAGYENLLEALRQNFAEAAVHPPAPPDFPVGRGVVICAGGWRYFPSLYVTVRMLRHVGCALPVQVWYLGDRGEFDPRMAQALEGWGVAWIDANAMWRDRPGLAIRRENVDHGWMLKPFAASFCPFREVLSLDADSYPVQNPAAVWDHPEFRRVGACFWPDFGPLQPGQWERFGVRPHDVPGLESGQFLIDKGRPEQWGSLWLTCWLNAHHEILYTHIYGDKDSFNLCWRKRGTEMCVPRSRPGWHVNSFLQPDFDGRTLFVHRTRDKFRFFGQLDGLELPQGYNTDQQGQGGNAFVRGLPGEEAAWSYYTECGELIRPGLHYHFRAGTWDEAIWQSVNLANEYGLPRQFAADDVVIDLGAHIGSFTNAALRRGAKHVVAVEPVAEHAALFRENLKPWIDLGRVTLYGAACWPGPEAPPLSKLADPENTGSYSLMRGLPGERVPTVRLDQLATGPVRLLKLDVEGAEFPILYGAGCLDRVQEIVGEYHEVTEVPAAADCGRPCTVEALLAFLGERGFRAEAQATGPGLGLFRAARV